MTQSTASNIRDMLLLCSVTCCAALHLVQTIWSCLFFRWASEKRAHEVHLMKTCLVCIPVLRKERPPTEHTMLFHQEVVQEMWTVIRYVEKFTEHPSLNNQLQSSTEPAGHRDRFVWSLRAKLQRRLHLQQPTDGTSSTSSTSCCTHTVCSHASVLSGYTSHHLHLFMFKSHQGILQNPGCSVMTYLCIIITEKSYQACFNVEFTWSSLEIPELTS